MEQMSNLEYADFWANDIADLSPLGRFQNDYNFHNEEQFLEIGDTITIQR